MTPLWERLAEIGLIGMARALVIERGRAFGLTDEEIFVRAESRMKTISAPTAMRSPPLIVSGDAPIPERPFMRAMRLLREGAADAANVFHANCVRALAAIEEESPTKKEKSHMRESNLERVARMMHKELADESTAPEDREGMKRALRELEGPDEDEKKLPLEDELGPAQKKALDSAFGGRASSGFKFGVTYDPDEARKFLASRARSGGR